MNVSMSFRRAAIGAAVCLLPSLARAQQPAEATRSSDSSRATVALRSVTVTATRRAMDVHDVPMPVSVLDSSAVRERTPGNAADLLRELPGVDVIGVGPNQYRPSIRGQRGQRILLLEDGMRMNNSRRQQDFGELPSLVDVAALERIEVVRGPASVLYGTDAIGGVINLITQAPPSGATAARLGGRAGYQYGSAGVLSKESLALMGAVGDWAWQVSGTNRRAGNYDAPAGAFGNLVFGNDVTVLDAGVRDRSLNAFVGWRGASSLSAFVKAEFYHAYDAGFGYVPNGMLGGDSLQKIQIRYPRQEVRKFTAGMAATRLGWVVADRVDATVYTEGNQRDLKQDIFIPFGPGTPPGAGVSVQTANYTDLMTAGTRIELSKVLSRALITYGADAFQDRSFNTDTSTQTVLGFGPPTPRGSNKSSVPNALLSSLGAFAQATVAVHERVTVIVGGRLQQVQSSPTGTPGFTTLAPGHTDATGVYAVNALVRLTDGLNVVGSFGSGFRAPNLVERYFNGPTPEGGAYQAATPALRPETSVNTDLGLKYRTDRFVGDVALFQNDISDGVVAAPRGDTINRLPVYQNVNVGRLQTRGAEISALVVLGHALSLRGNWSTIKSTNVLDPKSPIGDTFADKLNLAARWAVGRTWIEYAVRRNGEQKDIAVGASPVGNALPAFTVHAIRGGIRGWTIGRTRQDLTIAVNNLTNELYSEAANTSFFRPQPRRNVTIALTTSF